MKALTLWKLVQIGLWLAVAFVVLEAAYAHDMAAVLNSYGWGNNPYWLDVICSVGRVDCWT